MAELLDEKVIRDRFVVTIPVIIREILNLSVGDRIRFEYNGLGDICICKVRSHKVNNRFDGGEKNEI